MLKNIHDHVELASLARRKVKKDIRKGIHKADLESYINDGWAFYRNLKNNIQVKKEKLHSTLLEDKVWSLFYRMKFSKLSAEGGAKLILNTKEPDDIGSQIDIVAIDEEIALAVKCKSSLQYKRRPQFQELGSK
jgi:DNA sulfur modification protein DndB